MKKFNLYWLDGKFEEISGTDIADAFRRAGYGQGALVALDFYDEKVDNSPVEYVYNKERKTWVWTPSHKTLENHLAEGIIK